MARKHILEATIESDRPPRSAGRLDQRLADLALALRGVVAETQRMFIYPACQLDNDALDELAIALVEFLMLSSNTAMASARSSTPTKAKNTC